MTIDELSKKLIEVHDRRKELESQVDSLVKEYGELSQEFLQYVKNNDVDNIKIDGRCVHYSTEMRTSIVDQEKAFEFLRSKNAGDIIKLNVNSKTLGSTIKQLMEAGQVDITSMDNTGISIFQQEVVRVTKGK